MTSRLCPKTCPLRSPPAPGGSGPPRPLTPPRRRGSHVRQHWPPPARWRPRSHPPSVPAVTALGHTPVFFPLDAITQGSLSHKGRTLTPPTRGSQRAGIRAEPRGGAGWRAWPPGAARSHAHQGLRLSCCVLPDAWAGARLASSRVIWWDGGLSPPLVAAHSWASHCEVQDDMLSPGGAGWGEPCDWQPGRPREAERAEVLCRKTGQGGAGSPARTPRCDPAPGAPVCSLGVRGDLPRGDGACDLAV